MSDKYDGVPGMEGFETEDVEVPEIITLRPGEEPQEEKDEVEDDKIVLSKEDFENLKKGTDSTGALLEGLKGLQDAMKGPSQPVNVQQQPGESDEEFEKRLEKELFSEGKTGKAMKEAIQRYGGNQVSQLMGIISQQNREILELHPEKGKVFNRYRGEIEKFVKELPQEQQHHPQVWSYALEQVKSRHKDELEKETVDSLVEQRVAEKLKEMGITKDSLESKETVPKSKGGYMETGRGSAGLSKKSKKVYVTEGDKEAAAQSGVPLEQYLRKIGKL